MLFWSCNIAQLPRKSSPKPTRPVHAVRCAMHVEQKRFTFPDVCLSLLALMPVTDCVLVANWRASDALPGAGLGKLRRGGLPWHTEKYSMCLPDDCATRPQIISTHLFYGSLAYLLLIVAFDITYIIY